MGFYLDIEDDAGKAFEDSKWKDGKYSRRSELWTTIQMYWTDVRACPESDHRRPANEAEAEAVRTALRTWPKDWNRDLFLHAVDVVANNPALRFVPSY